MTVRIDARGLRCPWPAVRLARALRAGAGEVVVLADDPRAPGEIAAVAAQAGATVIEAVEDGIPAFRINAPFTQSP